MTTTQRASSICFLACLAANASGLDPPAGWRTKPFPGGQAFEPEGLAAGSRFEIVVGDVTALNGSALSDWLTEWRRPEVTGVSGLRCGQIQGDSAKGATLKCQGTAGSGPAAVMYSAAPPSQGRTRGIRLTMFGAPSQLGPFSQSGQALVDAALREVAHPGPEPAAVAPPSAPSAPPPAVGKGLKDSQIVGLGTLHEQKGWQYNALGGSFDMKWDVRTFTLLVGGKAYNGVPKGPLEDLDVAASRRAEPDRWGTWSTDGKPGQAGRYKVRFAGKAEVVNLSFAILAKPGEALSGSYQYAGTSSSPGFFASGWKAFFFRPDGTFEFSKGGGMTNNTALGTVSASEASSNRGHYRMSGNLIQLDYDDGHVVRASFYFDSEKKDVIVLDGQRLRQR